MKALCTTTLIVLALLCIGAGIVISNSVASADTDDYDSNGNGILEKDEVLAVVIDYFLNKLSKDEVVAVLIRYFLDPPTPTPTPTSTPAPSSTPTPTPFPTPYRGDVTAPHLLALTLDRSSVYAGYADGTIRVTVHATDDLSGVTYVDVRFKSPSGSQSVRMRNVRRSSGTTLNGEHVGTMTVLRFSEPGTWRLDAAWVSDRIGNSRQYNSTELARLGLSTSFEVSGTYSTGSGLRPRWEWSVEEPATREEIEAELEKYRGQSLVFSSWGGAYQSAQRQAYAVPFTEQFGIEIIDDSAPTLGKVRSQSQSGNVTWHLFDTGTGSIHGLAGTGDLERLDFSVIDNRHFFDVVKSPYIGGGGITWSEVWAYNTDVFPMDNQPHTMADIYDTERFPGRRAWAYYPDAEIVFILLSENPSLLYTTEGRASLAAPNEEQVDRAFELFEEYRDQVDWFWQTGSDCPRSLISGEMSLCTAWNGRILDAAKDGAPIRVCWECGHVVNTDGWSIIKGLKDQDPQAFELAQLYMAWTSLPEINARIAQFVAYGPINSASLPYLDGREYEEVRDELPSSTANIPYAILKDEAHVARHTDEWRERWIAFQQSFE